jgi:hypothetical protein
MGVTSSLTDRLLRREDLVNAHEAKREDWENVLMSENNYLLAFYEEFFVKGRILFFGERGPGYNKGLGNYQYTILLPIFGPSLTVPQSQNPRHNKIMTAVLFNQHSQI